MTENFNILVNKLKAFRKRYYTIRILKGLVTSILILLTLFVGISLIEYFFYFDSQYRTAVFYGYLVFSVLILIQYLGVPVLQTLKRVRLEKELSLVEMIQDHFPEIKDKLQNVLELSQESNEAFSNEIILASIDQKLRDVKVFDFNEAIKYKSIKKSLFFLGLSMLVSLGIGLVNTSIYKESTYRLVHFKQHFEKPAPFEYILNTKELKVNKGDNISIEVRTEGKDLPAIVFVNIAGHDYLMKNEGGGKFQYEIKSLINPVEIFFTDRTYQSGMYYIDVLPKPGVKGFQVQVEPPYYTGLEKSIQDNIGDITVPNGTKLSWTFQGIDVDSITICLEDSTCIEAEKEGDYFKIEKTFTKSSRYEVFLKNNITGTERALSYTIEVIPDLFPEIRVEQAKDSTSLSRFFFYGVVQDDYGFSALKFHVNKNQIDSAFTLPIERNTLNQEFYFTYDFSDLNPGNEVLNYYFSVSDNDQVNGHKTTTSNTFVFDMPDRKELLASEKQQFEDIQKKVLESQNLAAEIRKDLKNLQVKNMDSNVSDWEKTQLVNEIINKQNKLEQLYDQIQHQNAEMNDFVNSFNEEQQEMIEKQKQIEELLEEVFTEELKELMEEFEKLAKDFNSKKLNQLYDKMDLGFDDLQEQIDRNLEMLKKMKIEQKFQHVIDELNQLAQEQYKSATDATEKKNLEEISKNVDSRRERLNDLEKELKENLELNKELEEPLNLDDFNEDFHENRDQLDKVGKELQDKNKKKSQKELNESGEMLENMAFGMQQMLNSNTLEQNAENIDNLKQILDNLLYISENQEYIYNEVNGISSKDPKLIELNQKQKQIKDQSLIVKDSLYALAMRTPHINALVNSEILSMEMNLTKTSVELAEGNFSNATVSQLFTMTAVNNLALMLNEALEQLEKQMANAKPGDQQCENPGQGKQGMGSLKESAQGIKDQLQKMIDQMKQGNGTMSKDIGESLMQHEMMQQMIRDMMQNGDIGSGSQEILKEIDQMLEHNRKQLMNRNVNTDMLKRHNNITVRLLEAEKAEQERDFDNKRESQTADEFYSKPAEYFEHQLDKGVSIEYLNKHSHKLTRFYNKKYRNYLNKVK